VRMEHSTSKRLEQIPTYTTKFIESDENVSGKCPLCGSDLYIVTRTFTEGPKEVKICANKRTSGCPS
jgi:hypothetical protein